MIKFEIVSPQHRKSNGTPHLPSRATKHSAGYDIYTPVDIMIAPHGRCVIPTDIKVAMEEDMVFLIYIRSSVGIKRGVVISNGTGVIDSDYYNNPDNEGNIHLALTNTTDEPVEIQAGERIAQGVFVKYYTTNDDSVETTRVGGIGSTSK